MVICNGSGGTQCDDATGNNLESCNGANDDCDAATDEGFPVGQTCTVGVGACASTALRCSYVLANPATGVRLAASTFSAGPEAELSAPARSGERDVIGNARLA